MDEPILFSPTTHTHLLPSLLTLHQRCILEPTHTVATFLPPFTPTTQAQMETWWSTRISEISNGSRLLIMQMAKEEVAGIVMLEMPFAQTGPFRGVVQKLLVLPEFRGKGIARRLMGKLEVEARERGRGLLLLDTEKGSPAEVIYPRLGYVKVGEIPKYEISPLDGSLKDGVFFYKDMR